MGLTNKLHAVECFMTRLGDKVWVPKISFAAEGTGRDARLKDYNYDSGKPLFSTQSLKRSNRMPANNCDCRKSRLRDPQNKVCHCHPFEDGALASGNREPRNGARLKKATQYLS